MNTLNDWGDESRLEVYYSLGSLRDAEDEVLDEVGNAAIGDDEQPCNRTGNALGEVIALGAAIVAAIDCNAGVSWRRTRRWSGHQL